MWSHKTKNYTQTIWHFSMFVHLVGWNHVVKCSYINAKWEYIFFDSCLWSQWIFLLLWKKVFYGKCLLNEPINCLYAVKYDTQKDNFPVSVWVKIKLYDTEVIFWQDELRKRAGEKKKRRKKRFYFHKWGLFWIGFLIIMFSLTR